MTTPTAALAARIASLSTDALVEISLRLNLDTTAEAIIVCAKVEGELMRRLPQADFIAHCDTLDAMMDAAT